MRATNPYADRSPNEGVNVLDAAYYRMLAKDCSYLAGKAISPHAAQQFRDAAAKYSERARAADVDEANDHRWEWIGPARTGRLQFLSD